MTQNINDTRQQNKKNYSLYISATICGLISFLFLYISVIKGSFGGTIYDRIVYSIACLLFFLVVGYGIKKFIDEATVISSHCLENKRDAVQSFLFAIISFITLYYYNSASEYGHRLSMDVVTFALSLILLTMCTKEELMHPITQWTTVIAMALALDKGIYKHYEDYRVIVKFTAERIALCVFVCVLATAIVQYIKKVDRCKISIIGKLYTLFIACVLVFSNNRTWPLYTGVLLLLLCVRPVGRQNSLSLIRNYVKGVIMAFWTMFATAILCRPYYSFEFSRYPGWFSSVASAGIFWVICFVCALLLLLEKWTKGELPFKTRIRECFYELVTMGAVLTHLLLSMSRTSVLSVALAAAFAFLMVEVFNYRDSIGEMCKKLIVMVLSLLLLFPICYTMIRCVPAMVSMPYRVSGPEWFSDQIEVGEAWDSTKFMNIAQYGETLLEKLVGLQINLSEMAGASSGPEQQVVIGDTDMDVDQGFGTYEKDGQIYTKKDYTFVNDSEGEESNGRFDIMKAYLNNLNLTGHELSSLEQENGEFVAYHAHNTYVQVAFDHGMPTGIIFIVLTASAMLVSIGYYKKQCRIDGMSLFPALVIFSFAVSGMTEWIFHPSIPLGFAYLMAFVPLYRKED